MKARLNTFRYIPRGTAGWQSNNPPFGELLTAVQGENGTGKTPIMKGIVAALGHRVEFPDAVVQHCAAAELNLLVDGRPVVLRREVSKDFVLHVEDDGKPTEYREEKAFSEWLATTFGATPRTLTNKQRAASALYANALIPGFWADQDHGWTQDYWAPLNFIESQREEVIRFLVGVPARHPFASQDAFQEAKASLERAETTLEHQKFLLKRIEGEQRFSAAEIPALAERRKRLQDELAANSTVLEAARNIGAKFDQEIARLETERQSLVFQLGQLRRSKNQLTLVMAQVEGEVDILTSNTQAADFFRQLCAREECQMFATPQQSYGRALLFLKDQIKDLQVSSDELTHDAADVESQIRSLEAKIAEQRAERGRAVSTTADAQLIGRVDALAKDLVATEVRAAQLEQFLAEQSKFERLLDQREQAFALVEQYRPHRGASEGTSVSDARALLTESLQEWLRALGTPNVREAAFDSDFNIVIDGHKFGPTSQESGSTRLRIVLAFYASLLEVGVRLGGNHPGWLLLDAPKQHELNQRDFDSYVDRLRRVAALHPGRIQLVFSVADLKTNLEVGDERWDPPFTFPELDPPERFLGSLSRRTEAAPQVEESS